MNFRYRTWRRRFRFVVLPACAIALTMPAGAIAAQPTDLRSPDTRDAARQAGSEAVQVEPSPAAPTVQRIEHGSQTLPIVLASMALVIALAGIAVAIGAFFRRPRPRWTAG
jgi:hypothetical protein